ncbi:Cyclophilin type peptidyl-prolyl cis-trans isomerase/CLD [Gracilaria domingensis]|nr:Cyclophilin type peptidyl-prolyl cis-trans isomerase/CLD [Gracilaria domingensis]
MVADDDGLAKSQFFITLTKAEWLDGQHTIFAQVVGDTIYNVLNIAATGERNHADDDAPKIKSVTVDLNPFPDLLPANKDQATAGGAKKEPVKKPVRNKRLLSFANDSDSDSDDSAPTRMLKPAETKRRIRRNSDSTLFLCQRDPPAASDPKPEAQPSAAADRKRKHPDQSDAVRKANEEFERLKAELAGMDEKDKEKHQSQPAKEEDGKEDETEAMCRAMAEVTTEDERDDRRRRKRRRKDEGETLRRLKAFEGKVVQARRMGDSADDGKMWYAKRLNLATMAGDDDEYEVRMPKAKRGSMKLRRG